MSYPRIVNAIFTKPWAINRPWLGSMFTLLHSKVFDATQLPSELTAEAIDLSARLRHGAGMAHFSAARWGRDTRGLLVNHSERIHAFARQRATSNQDYYNIVRQEEDQLVEGQILHIFGAGIIGKHLSMMEELCAGGLSIDRIQEALRLARDDAKVTAVMLQFDSPGGLCYGCTETAAQIEALRATKHVTTFCDSLCASAAYWCGATADFQYVTPSAEIGSIGVYCAIVDYTEWCAQQGIKVNLIADGTHKGAGYPGTTLTEEQLALIKAEVAATGATFRADVRKGRTAAVADATMQGQTFTGADAVKAALADAVVPSLEAALADVAKTI